jgi:hypothetical protein
VASGCRPRRTDTCAHGHGEPVTCRDVRRAAQSGEVRRGGKSSVRLLTQQSALWPVDDEHPPAGKPVNAEWNGLRRETSDHLALAVTAHSQYLAGTPVAQPGPSIAPSGRLRKAQAVNHDTCLAHPIISPARQHAPQACPETYRCFPELGRLFYDSGPGRTIDTLAATFESLAARGTLRLQDPRLAAEHFNWLVMSAPLNRIMLCGDAELPAPADLDRYADAGTRAFLAAYGAK